MPATPQKRRRLADRAAGVGAGRARAQRRGDRGRRAARRAARHVRERPGVAHGTARAVLVRRAHRELVHVELAERDGAGVGEPLRDGRLERRHEPAQDLRGARGLDTARDEDILDADRHARERTGITPRRARGVDCVGAAARAVGVDQHIAVERAIEPRDAVEVRFRDVARTQLAGAHPVGDRGDRQAADVDIGVAHDSSSIGPPPCRRHDARHLEEARLAPRGVLQRFFDGQRHSHLVRTDRTVERHGVGHRLDRRRVEILERGDVTQNSVEIGRHALDLLSAQVQSREHGDLADLLRTDA